MTPPAGKSINMAKYQHGKIPTHDHYSKGNFTSSITFLFPTLSRSNTNKRVLASHGKMITLHVMQLILKIKLCFLMQKS